MLYTKEIIKDIVKGIRQEINKTSFIIVLNDKNKMAVEGRLISFNKRYIKIKNQKHGIHRIAISDIKNIVTLIM